MYIYKAAVIGAGAMGAEIAQVISYAGLPVILKDVDAKQVDQGIARCRAIYDGRVKKGKMTESDVAKKMALIQPATDYAEFRDVDIAIEAVPEKMDIKQKVFAEMDQACPPGAILATNTSALSISQIATHTRRPDKVVGLHFFYPAHVMKLVEVVPGLATSDEAVTDVMSFCESLRKIAIRVGECAGFLVNRLMLPYLNEAAWCLQEGTSPDSIDQAMKQFGWPMGPFTLVDQLGLDICYDTAVTLEESYGPRMKTAPIWHQVYQTGRYGAKRGAGFYVYDAMKWPDKDFLQKAIAACQAQPALGFSPERLMFAMVNEAAHSLTEHVTTLGDLETGMLAGLGFPQEKGGLLKYADSVGLDVILKSLESWYQKSGSLRFWPAPLLKRMVGAGWTGTGSARGFYERT